MAIMRKGKIKCDCGNEFSFHSIKEKISCLGCGKIHPNNGEEMQPKELIEIEHG